MVSEIIKFDDPHDMTHHRQALISVSLGISQTPANTANMDRELMHRVVCLFTPGLGNN